MAGGVRNYLKQMQTLKAMSGMRGPLTYRFGSIEEFFLAKGKDYASEPLTPEEIVVVKTALDNYGRSCQIKQCFFNSMMVGLTGDTSEKLVYTEGYTTVFGLPISHAWLTINDKVVDFTIREKKKDTSRTFMQNRNIGTFPEDREYYGVKFKRSFVRRFVAETKMAGSVVEDFTRDFPVLKDGRGVL